LAASLGTSEVRVAASSTQYELAERLWAVRIAAWSYHQFHAVLPKYDDTTVA